MSSTPLASSRTQPSIRSSWVGRHSAGLGVSAGTIAGILATLIANMKPDVDLLKAATTYGLPTTLCVCMGAVILWLVAIYVPKGHEAAEERLDRLQERHELEMAHFREVQAAERDTFIAEREKDREIFRQTLTDILESHAADRTEMREIRTQVERIHDRLDGLASGQHPRIAPRRTTKEPG